MQSKPKTEQRLESRTEILRAAVQLIARRGCAGATVGRIAEAAGVSTATVFWHFKDKSHLLQAVAHHIKDTWVARVKTDALSQGAGRTRLERLLRNHAAWIGTDAAYLRTFVLLGLEAPGMDEPEVAAYVRELAELLTRFLTDVVRAGQADGSLGSDAPAAQVAEAVSDALLGAVVRDAIRGRPDGADGVVDILVAAMGTSGHSANACDPPAEPGPSAGTPTPFGGNT